MSAKEGNVVKVHYTGKLEDGTMFDSSRNRDPLQFRLGEGQVIPGFEQAIIGMDVGDSKSVEVPPDKAYGAHRDERVYVIDKSKFPADVAVGQQYQIAQEKSEPSVVTVTDISKGTVTLDGNHPLAGRNLLFDIQLVEVI